MEATPFRFDANTHEYVNIRTGDVRPHITGMLQAEGLIDDRWFTEESCERGSCVHRLTADYDLGALDPRECDSKYKGWLLGHVALMRIVNPSWRHVEEPMLHRALDFGGRPDRVGTIYGAVGVWEIKSGLEDPAHAIQLAMQAILAAPIVGLPAESLVRYAAYLKSNGKYKLVEYKQRRDFDEAHRIIRRWT